MLPIFNKFIIERDGMWCSCSVCGGDPLLVGSTAVRIILVEEPGKIKNGEVPLQTKRYVKLDHLYEWLVSPKNEVLRFDSYKKNDLQASWEKLNQTIEKNKGYQNNEG